MGWKSYEDAADRGPGALGWKAFKSVMIAVIVVTVVGTPIMCALGFFTEGAAVIREEFGPREMLRKYEWFKDAAAQLDKKRADIGVYKVQIDELKEVPRADRDRTDKEQLNLWQREMAGIKASYNGLAAEYNAQMAKFNWAFANTGQLPQGATVPLPREFKPYTSE